MFLSLPVDFKPYRALDVIQRTFLSPRSIDLTNVTRANPSPRENLLADMQALPTDIANNVLYITSSLYENVLAQKAFAETKENCAIITPVIHSDIESPDEVLQKYDLLVVDGYYAINYVKQYLRKHPRVVVIFGGLFVDVNEDADEFI